MTSRALEFHDSQLESVAGDSNGLSLTLQAYVHESRGRPGIDPGTGWHQRVLVKIEDPVCDLGSLAPSSIADGELWTPNGHRVGIVPIPLDEDGKIRLDLQFTGAAVSLTGSRIVIAPIGEPKFVDHFPGQ